jgi:Protein of unknown function (DUF3800)
VYRLYVDEVGTDGLTHVDKDKHRFLSLTGVAMLRDDIADGLTVKMNWIKQHVFKPDPDDKPIILHRTDILGLKGVFGELAIAEKRELFNKALLRMIDSSDYTVITALIDKAWMLKQGHWYQNHHPYHYLMEILVEKYAQFLERKKQIGDIMPESRGDKDTLLQKAYDSVRKTGTYYVPRSRMIQVLPGSKLKFRKKWENISGLQLCDLLAHPSHMNVRKMMGHDVTAQAFRTQVIAILEEKKYDRSSSGKIRGYGVKHLP